MLTGMIYKCVEVEDDCLCSDADDVVDDEVKELERDDAIYTQPE
jgi:hypothetical protein